MTANTSDGKPVNSKKGSVFSVQFMNEKYSFQNFILLEAKHPRLW